MVFLWPFDIFFPFWIVVPRNFWQPWILEDASATGWPDEFVKK
jgi:hypothetical protein